ncbi:hypothetical protein [Amycolatopsis suaedae]|uniref:PASTA domain-containing protein n=1 Tax=Amycolatopsis suaedae TaxID=2510978 RepID=A0A4Q7J3B7_9PSEU|nr:hypothetical protein [Amycolatopsis suaedae]RZQ61278.1 hypothetical protein EWH70_25790 [Amycolatopsis suaedae]
MRTALARFATAAVVTLGVVAPLGIAGGVASAAPATGSTVQADTISPASVADCQGFLRKVGYKVGPKVTNACKVGSSPYTNWACPSMLIAIKVHKIHAAEACKRALR